MLIGLSVWGIFPGPDAEERVVEPLSMVNSVLDAVCYPGIGPGQSICQVMAS